MKSYSFFKLVNNARGFWRDRRGVTAIEFAIVAVPFLLLTMGALEVSVIHLTRSSVQSGMQRATRTILTGEAGCVTPDAFKQEVCSHVSLANESACISNMRVILEELDDFNAERSSFSGDFDSMGDQTASGAGGSVMMLQVLYRWEVVLPMIDKLMAGDQGVIIMRNSTAFRNEPYGESGGCAA